MTFLWWVAPQFTMEVLSDLTDQIYTRSNLIFHAIFAESYSQIYWHFQRNHGLLAIIMNYEPIEL